MLKPIEIMKYGVLGGSGRLWYVRPSGLTYGTGDGTSYNNAFNNWITVIAKINDDTINAGDTIFMAENGIYEFDADSGGLLLTKGVRITGVSEAGVIVQPDVAEAQLGLGHAIFYTDQSNCSFFNFTLDGRLTDNPSWTYVANSDAAFTERSSGIEFKVGADNWSVTNVTAKNMTRNGICARGSNWSISNFTAYNTMSANLKLGGTGEATLAGGNGANSTFNGTLSNITLGKTIAKECLEINDGVHNVTIDDFDIDGESKCPWWSLHDHGNADESNSGITLRNGSMINGAAGNAIFFDMQASGNTNTNVLIENTTLTSSLAGVIFRIKSNNFGIILSNVQGTGVCLITYNGGVLTAPDNVQLINTTSFIAGATPDTINEGILFRGATNVIMDASHSKGWERNGVYIQDADVIIRNGCEIHNNGNTLIAGSAIELVGDGTVSITGNSLGNVATTKTKYALTKPAGYADLVFEDNVILDPTISPMNGTWAGSSASVSGNTGMPNWPNEATGYSSNLQPVLDAIVDLGNPLPTSGELAHIETFIAGLVTDGLWARGKTLYLTAVGSRGMLRVNFINPSTFLRSIQLGTAAQTLPWTNLVGYKSNGTSYVNDNYKTDQYAGIETDLTQGTYLSESNTTTGNARAFGARVLSASAAFHEVQLINSGTTATRRHYNATSVNYTNSNNKGLYIHTYDGTNDVIYKEGTKTSNAATPVAPTISCDFLSAARNTASSSGTVTAAAHNNVSAHAIDFRFDRFNDTDESNFRGRWNTLKASLGIN